MAIGGDILELTFNHPTIGSGVVFAKAGEDNTFDAGGLRTGDDANMIDGGGNMIQQMNRVRWSFEATTSPAKTLRSAWQCRQAQCKPIGLYRT
jgi:hypothetical protein